MSEKEFKTIEKLKVNIIDNCYYNNPQILINNIYFSGVKKDEEGYINYIRRITIKPENLDFSIILLKIIVKDCIESYSELYLDI